MPLGTKYLLCPGSQLSSGVSRNGFSSRKPCLISPTRNRTTPMSLSLATFSLSHLWTTHTTCQHCGGLCLDLCNLSQQGEVPEGLGISQCLTLFCLTWASSLLPFKGRALDTFSYLVTGLKCAPCPTGCKGHCMLSVISQFGQASLSPSTPLEWHKKPSNVHSLAFRGSVPSLMFRLLAQTPGGHLTPHSGPSKVKGFPAEAPTGLLPPPP